jgi:excisionase family DNA binding protein
MSGVPRLLERLSTLAEQRSNLLAAEARLWAEASQVLGQVASEEFVHPRKVEVPAAKSTVQLLSTKQAAEYLSLAKATLERWRVYGGGPKFTKLGGRIFYHRSALDSFIAAKTYPHTSAYK